MPTENTDDKKFTESLDKKAKTVDIDTSGPGAEVIVPEDKDESVVDAKEKEATVTLTEEKEPGTTDHVDISLYPSNTPAPWLRQVHIETPLVDVQYLLHEGQLPLLFYHPF